MKTRLGYHVIRVNSRTAEQDQPLSLVKEGIRARLLAQRTQAQAMSQARLMSEALTRDAAWRMPPSSQGWR